MSLMFISLSEVFSEIDGYWLELSEFDVYWFE